MRGRVLGAAVLAGLLAGCTREEMAPAAVRHFVDAAPGTPAPTYTLTDETRPILAAPPERRLRLTVPSGLTGDFTFALPPGTWDGAVLASGVCQRAKRLTPIEPQRLRLGESPRGAPTATMTLPAAARGPGPAAALSLVLTRPPADGRAETRVEPIDVPPAARLRFAYALSDASGVAGAAPVRLEVAATDAAGETVPLWSAVLRPGDLLAHRWRETRVALDALAGDRIGLVFRAVATGDGVPIVVPLWGDPTVVAPAPRPPARRNVILVSLDTLRADRVGVYGAYRDTTPALDALARESVVFTNAWAPWPETSGSHMSLFTSRYPSEHGVTSFITAPPDSLTLLAERLRAGGYLTRAFTEDGGVWAVAGFARGFSAYSERRSADFVYRGDATFTFEAAARWVRARKDRPFFLFVHTYQVHAPYRPPAAYRDLFADVAGREDPRQVLQALAYDRETRYTDDELAGLIATVRELGLAERSIVIVTSDHGEEFGEHGGHGHGHSLHREVLAVPLIIWAPGLLEPARIDTPVSLLDVAPTVLDLVGLPPDPAHRGESLRAAAGGEGDPGRPIFAEVDRVDGRPIRFAAVRTAEGTAILDRERDQLRCYDPEDVEEARPHATCPAREQLLRAHLTSTRALGGRAIEATDPRLVEKMRALGYID